MNDEEFREQLSGAVRHLAEGGPPQDRDAAIGRIEALLRDEAPSAESAVMAEALLGILLYQRVIGLPAGAGHSLASVFASPPVPRDLSDPAVRAELDRAAALLRGTQGNPSVPAELQAFAGLITASAAALKAETLPELDQEIVSMGGLLEQVLAGMPPGPGHAELQGIALWCRASAAIAAGEPAGPVVSAAEALADSLGETHLLGPMLLAELGADLARRAEESGDGEDLELAGRLLSRGWHGIAPHRDHPLWSLALRRNAGASVVEAVLSGESGARDEAQRLAGLVAREGGDEPGSQFFAGLSSLLLSYLHGEEDRFGDAVRDIATAAGHMHPEHEMWPVTMAMLGATLSEEWMRNDGLEGAAAGEAYLRMARRRLEDVARMTPSASRDLLTVRGMSALLGIKQKWDDGEFDGVDQHIDALKEAVAGLPRGHVMRRSLVAGLAATKIGRGARRADVTEIAEGARMMMTLADGPPPRAVAEAGMKGLAGMGTILLAMIEAEGGRPTDERITGGLHLLEQAQDLAGAAPGEAVITRSSRAGVLLALHRQTGDDDHLDEAIRVLKEGCALLAKDRFNPVAGRMLRDLATALERRAGPGEREEAVAAGLAALERMEEDVLLQTDVAYGLTAVRDAAAYSATVASSALDLGDCEAALAALERGRGLVLSAATASLSVPDLLRSGGEERLAEQWELTGGGRRTVRWDTLPDQWNALRDRSYGDLVSTVVGTQMAAPLPSDLRHRVLSALAEAGRSVLPPPSSGVLAEALRRVGMDALVYLLPGRVRAVGRVLVLRADGTFTQVEPLDMRFPVSAGLEEVCDWAGIAVMEPLVRAAREWAPGREPRLTLVPMMALRRVHWHAARYGGRHACEDAVISYIASGRQLADLAGRPSRPLTANVAMVADPTRDLPYAGLEVDALRAAFYPFGRVYGPQGESGTGRPAEVLGCLPTGDRLGASLLHLACHASSAATPEASYLKLAADPDPDTSRSLTAARILRQASGRPAGAPGGLVVLSACRTDLTPSAHDEALTLATAFLVAGAATVVGSRWAVPDDRTAGLMFMFHHYLADASPADALRRAQMWMLDPARVCPPAMPERLRTALTAPGVDLTDMRCWAAFTHQGR
ncbi:hypothetical protein GCM10009677_02140 [Sphaerisporangium rubeum]|uniref:CHAT domain-containing protein n=1 Tax=Sphaerisporangium rubeum TaxID=321317 RepID=A0A7X0M675_9ACTN|nr:CHAT domain-containing protein [Sphaerisporangium rubeum]MBB6473165.1 hypothetical protein [Sphaerisporangium rubeum]